MANKAQHPSLGRLLDAAMQATAHLPPSQRIGDFDALRRRMGQTPQGWNAWKDRGLSRDGALKAEELFGCSAVWLLTGKAPMRWPSRTDTALVAQQDGATYRVTRTHALQTTLEAMAKAPAGIKAELAQVLNLLVTTGSEDYVKRLLRLLVSEEPDDSARVSRATDEPHANPEPAALVPQYPRAVEAAAEMPLDASAQFRRSVINPSPSVAAPKTPPLPPAPPPDTSPRRSSARSAAKPTPNAKVGRK